MTWLRSTTRRPDAAAAVVSMPRVPRCCSSTTTRLVTSIEPTRARPRCCTNRRPTSAASTSGRGRSIRKPSAVRPPPLANATWASKWARNCGAAGGAVRVSDTGTDPPDDGHQHGDEGEQGGHEQVVPGEHEQRAGQHDRDDRHPPPHREPYEQAHGGHHPDEVERDHGGRVDEDEGLHVEAEPEIHRRVAEHDDGHERDRTPR